MEVNTEIDFILKCFNYSKYFSQVSDYLDNQIFNGTYFLNNYRLKSKFFGCLKCYKIRCFYYKIKK